jgi:hypothetical protein
MLGKGDGRKVSAWATLLHLWAIPGNVSQVLEGLLVHGDEVAAKAASKGEAGAGSDAGLHNCVLLRTHHNTVYVLLRLQRL